MSNVKDVGNGVTEFSEPGNPTNLVMSASILDPDKIILYSTAEWNHADTVTVNTAHVRLSKADAFDLAIALLKLARD